MYENFHFSQLATETPSTGMQTIEIFLLFAFFDILFQFVPNLLSLSLYEIGLPTITPFAFLMNDSFTAPARLQPRKFVPQS